MSLWPNPVPPVPSLRERYPLSGVPLPSIPATILWSAALAVISVFFFAPIMDKFILRLINAIKPSFVPPKGELKTERQAIERLAYQTAAITGNLLVLWPMLITSFISLVEGFAWVIGRKSPLWIPYILFAAEMFMGNSLFAYYKDVPKILLQLDQLRNDDLLQSAEQIFMGADGQSRVLGYDRYEHEITLSFGLELRFRSLLLAKPITMMTRLQTLGLSSIAVFITFIADRSSKITCASPDKLWAQCGPFMRLGVPLSSPMLAFMVNVTFEWWSTRRVTKGGNEIGWAPRMCQRGLQRQANQLWRLQKQDWREVWMYEYQMQEGRLLWGCPWKPNSRQMEAWMRSS